MSRKDFELIARVIASLPEDMRIIVARSFADSLATTNARFDRSKFMRACCV